MMETAFVFAIVAGGATALAYGYRGQRDQEREQVIYLRKQLEARNNPPPRGDDRGAQQREGQGQSRAVAVVQG